jgi:hypothetical protein
MPPDIKVIGAMGAGSPAVHGSAVVSIDDGGATSVVGTLEEVGVVEAVVGDGAGVESETSAE